MWLWARVAGLQTSELGDPGPYRVVTGHTDKPGGVGFQSDRDERADLGGGGGGCRGSSTNGGAGCAGDQIRGNHTSDTVDVDTGEPADDDRNLHADRIRG